MKLDVKEKKVEVKKEPEKVEDVNYGIKVPIIESLRHSTHKETYIIPEQVCRFEGRTEGTMSVWLNNSPNPLHIAIKVEDFVKLLKK